MEKPGRRGTTLERYKAKGLPIKYKEWRPRKNPPLGRVFSSSARVCKPNSVLQAGFPTSMSSNLSGLNVAVELKRHFPRLAARDTALHPGKNFAVSPPLKELVSVRISCDRQDRTTGVTCYLFNPSIALGISVRTFLPRLAAGATTQRAGSIVTLRACLRQYRVPLQSPPGLRVRTSPERTGEKPPGGSGDR